MTNLDRLKGSGLLIQGFDELVAQWLNQEPNPRPVNWDIESMPVFKDLPPAVGEFYLVIQRWPKTLLESKLPYQFFFPPQINDNGFIKIAAMGGLFLEFVVSPHDGENSIYSKEHDSPVGHLKLQCDPETWLVSMGLFMLIQSTHTDELFQRPEPEFRMVFNGFFAFNEPCAIRYHPDGFLWFSGVENDLYAKCSHRGFLEGLTNLSRKLRNRDEQ